LFAGSSGLLAALAAASHWLGGLLQGAGAKIQSFRLTHFEFVPRPDDVFIVTYPRSGTTWMQMILYQLTTDGGMDLPHIAEYCPWFERSLRSARGFETRPSPRLFKSHLPFARIPKGPCKYIYVARGGQDVALSYYHLYRTYNGYQGTFAEFFDLFLRGKVEFGSWFQHVKGWWLHRHDPNVLFLTYEEMTRDLEGCVRKISTFCGFDVPPDRLPVILERCGFSFMKQHENRFDPALETLWESGVRLNCFLRNGRSGEGKEALTAQQEAHFKRAFQKQLGATGLAFGLERRQFL
jgi:sulfotransferase family protein